MKKLPIIILLLVSMISYSSADFNPYISGSGLSQSGADETAPEFDTATIDGEDLVINFNEPVKRGAGYSDSHIDLDGLQGGTKDNVGVTYQSGDETTQLIYIADYFAEVGDTVNLDFDGTATSITDLAGTPNDLAALDSVEVTNLTSGACTTSRDT